MEDAREAILGDLGSCGTLEVGAPLEKARDEAKSSAFDEMGIVFDVCLIEGLRTPSIPSAPGPWYDDGLEIVTQSGSGLGVKGFDGL